LFTFAKDALRANEGQSAKLLIHTNGSGAATRNSSETSIKHKMLRIKPRLAFIYGVLLENRVLIFRFQLLAVYVLLVHNCGECRIGSTLFSAHWKWFDTFFVLTGNGSTHFSDYNWIIVS
jgi:hypothetical protein